MKNPLGMGSSWRRSSVWAPRRLGVAATLLSAGATVLLLYGSARADDIPLPTHNTPERQIRFTNANGAEERRAQLVQFIWPDGLPTGLPTVYPVEHFPPELSRSLARVAGTVERLDVNIGAWDYHAQVLLLHPTRPLPKNRLVLIHQGHSPLISFGLERAMQHFLDAGLSVAVFHMPLIGLSGGGWATSMAAALDVRIKFSAPVAGSGPLYARNQDSPSVGDAEQIYAPLYDEAIAEDGTGGGVATWLEIYALGAIGRGRRQCMITNQFDKCCFSGHFADSFKHLVASVVQQCGEGTWEHVLDSSHREHKISGRVLNQVVAPALQIPAWTDHNLPLFDRFAELKSHETALLVNRELGAVFVEVRENRSRDQKPERLRIGALDGYQGGPLRLSIEIAPDGFIAQLDGESKWTSDRIPWAQIPGGFSLRWLGDAAMLGIRVTSISASPDESPESKPSRGVLETASVEILPQPIGQ